MDTLYPHPLFASRCATYLNVHSAHTGVHRRIMPLVLSFRYSSKIDVDYVEEREREREREREEEEEEGIIIWKGCK